MSETETTNISVTRHRDCDGEPTCALDFPAGKVCQFYVAQRFGLHETCLFASKSSHLWHPLERRKDGMGTLIPLDTCPVWPSAG